MEDELVAAALAGWWVADDGKTVLIETAGGDASSGSLLVSVSPSRGAEPYRSPWLTEDDGEPIEQRPAVPGTEEDRTWFLEIEAGVTGLGPTYRLYPVLRAADGGWRQPADWASSSAPPDALLPNVRTGFYDWWEEHCGVPWSFPLLPLLPATRLG